MPKLQKLKLNLMKPIDLSLVERPNPILHIGSGKLGQAGRIAQSFGVTSLCIITDKSLRKLGLLDPLLQSLEDSGCQYTIFDEVTPDPTYKLVQSGVDFLRAQSCTGVIAIGGGSVIDAAKTMIASYDSNKDPHALKGLLRVKKRTTPFVVIPTTAGTGSETTIVAVISDSETHKKSLVISPKLIPDAVILDPQVTISLPPSLTATTAADALTHALEAYVSCYATKTTQFYSETAVRLIWKGLEKSLQDPKDLQAREDLLVGSLYGGMAFTRAYVGYVHAFSHNIGGKFGVPHGLANSVILPYIMRFYQSTCSVEFARLAQVLALPVDGLLVEEQAESFLVELERFLASAGIPEILQNFPLSGVPEIVEMGFKECHSTYPVPKYLTKQEAVTILERCANR